MALLFDHMPGLAGGMKANAAATNTARLEQPAGQPLMQQLRSLLALRLLPTSWLPDSEMSSR